MSIAAISAADDDLLIHVLNFVGEGQYAFVAGVNTTFRSALRKRHALRGETAATEISFATSAASVVESISRVAYAWSTLVVGEQPDPDDARIHAIVEAAATHADEAVLAWIMERCPNDLRNNRFRETLSRSAAKCGRCSVLEWAKDVSVLDPLYVCEPAAEWGQLHVLQWMWRWMKGYARCEEPYAIAARQGHLHILEWVSKTGMFVGAYMTKSRSAFSVDEWWSIAASSGHIHILQWGKECRLLWNTDNNSICREAAMAGHLEVLQWAVENRYSWDKSTCSWAAKYGQLHILQWARENGCPWDAFTCSMAAGSGHLNVLKWARRNGCPWDTYTCSSAARWGHLSVLQWARENGCPWDCDTCTDAAYSGHIDVLHWARANGCPWDELTCSYAAQRGHLTILQWAWGNGCPWDEQTCSSTAYGGYLSILQ